MAESGRAERGDYDGGCRAPENPLGFDDAELEAALREFVGPLVSLLDPSCSELVYRTEILGQPLATIAGETGLDQQSIAERLQAGRRDLLHLIILTLKPTSEG